MKTMFVCPLHSITDVITNSSSELFICRTDKTLQEIEQILKQLLLEYQLKEKGLEPIDAFEHLIDGNLNFDEVFAKPQIATNEDVGMYDYVAEGDLIIVSRQDNSIPYDLFDPIEFIFNAKRHHLG